MHRVQSSAYESGLGPSSQSPVTEALKIRSWTAGLAGSLFSRVVGTACERDMGLMLPAHLSMHFPLVIKQAAITILFYLRGGKKKRLGWNLEIVMKACVWVYCFMRLSRDRFWISACCFQGDLWGFFKFLAVPEICRKVGALGPGYKLAFWVIPASLPSLHSLRISLWLFPPYDCMILQYAPWRHVTYSKEEFG